MGDVVPFLARVSHTPLEVSALRVSQRDHATASAMVRIGSSTGIVTVGGSLENIQCIVGRFHYYKVTIRLLVVKGR